MTSPRPRGSLDEHLATLGVVPGLDLALDATITPQTLARESGASASPPSERSVGALPRLALSGAAGQGDRVDPTASADLELLGVIGEGGMGRVHLARQRSLGREVAIKMLKDEAALGTHATEMLRAEATIMGRLEHPNVVPVHAVGLDGAGRLVLVMKRIEGAPWRDLLHDPAHPRWQELAPRLEDRLDAHLGVLAQVANALELAHQRGIVHRDVKPENVLLGAYGEVYLADWGIALRTEGAEGSDLVGTPAYMAPEMVAGLRANIDARTDVFLLGATLHEVLTGAPPHQGKTVHEVLLRAFDGEEPTYAADVPPELAAIARRAMAKDPSARFASARELRAAIDEVRRHRGAIALTQASRAQLAEIEAALSAPSTPGAARLDKLLTECRVGLATALREWPESTEARRALAQCLRLAVRHEIGRKSPVAARALLAELEGGDPALESAIAALELEANEREAELARLRSLDQDADLSIGLVPRAVMLVSLLLAGLVVSGIATFQSQGDPSRLDAWDIVRFSSLVFGTMCALLVVFGRRLLANAIGARTTVLFLLGTGGLVVHRIVAALLGIAPRATLTTDLVLLAIVASASGTVIPRGALSAIPVLLGIGAALAWPDHTAVVFSAATVSMVLVLMVVGLLELRRNRPTAGATAPRPDGSADRRPPPADDTRSK